MQKNRQTALLGRGAGTPYECFAPGKTAAQAEFISAEHFNPKGESRLWRLEPKKKDMTCWSCLSFWKRRLKSIFSRKPCGRITLESFGQVKAAPLKATPETTRTGDQRFHPKKSSIRLPALKYQRHCRLSWAFL